MSFSQSLSINLVANSQLFLSTKFYFCLAATFH